MSGDLVTTLLFFAPALLICLTLLLGYFPGERLLVRWALRRRGRIRFAPAIHSRIRCRWIQINPRGGRLLAWRLAGRAPPGVSAPQAMSWRRPVPTFT
jgi:hypothetical protein